MNTTTVEKIILQVDFFFKFATVVPSLPYRGIKLLSSHKNLLSFYKLGNSPPNVIKIYDMFRATSAN